MHVAVDDGVVCGVASAFLDAAHAARPRDGDDGRGHRRRRAADASQAWPPQPNDGAAAPRHRRPGRAARRPDRGRVADLRPVRIRHGHPGRDLRGRQPPRALHRRAVAAARSSSSTSRRSASSRRRSSRRTERRRQARSGAHRAGGTRTRGVRPAAGSKPDPADFRAIHRARRRHRRRRTPSTRRRAGGSAPSRAAVSRCATS